jgi:hypothetical protein
MMTTRPAPDTSTEDGALQKRLRSDLALKASSSTSLFQIPSERDVLTDDDHGALDENIFKTFNAHKKWGEIPELDALLSTSLSRTEDSIHSIVTKHRNCSATRLVSKSY